MCALSENPFVSYFSWGFEELLFLRHSYELLRQQRLSLLLLLHSHSRNSTWDVSIECCLGYIFRNLFDFICSFFHVANNLSFSLCTAP